MTNAFKPGSISILGAEQACCGDAGGLSEQEMIALAAEKAIRASGLKKSDIDGFMTASLTSPWWVMRMAEYLGIRPSFSGNTMYGGSAFIAQMHYAAMALEARECNALLICYGANPRSAPSSSEINAMRARLDPQLYEHPYKPFNPVSSYALAAARHMHEFGTTREQMAEVAVSARKWAQLNPEAFSRDPLTIEDVLSSPMISDPLTVRDCCLVTDGAGAYVMMRSDDAKAVHPDPIHLLGVASAHWHRQISEMPNLTVTAASQSGAQAFAQAGLKPSDIDVVQLYDAFTINPILFLEDLGFCNKGEGGAIVADGRIAPGGELPVNTNGGGLSFTHPGMYSVFLVIEAVRQLRRDAGAGQVAGAKTALVNGNGGVLSSQATAILARAS